MKDLNEGEESWKDLNAKQSKGAKDAKDLYEKEESWKDLTTNQSKGVIDTKDFYYKEEDWEDLTQSHRRVLAGKSNYEGVDNEVFSYRIEGTGGFSLPLQPPARGRSDDRIIEMVSPEYLSRYPFFRILKPDQLIQIATIANEESYPRGTVLFAERAPAKTFYILLKGSVELFFTVETEYHPELRKELKFRVIYPGETFGISAFIKPHILTSSARALEPSAAIGIRAEPLLEMCEQDEKLAMDLMYQVAKAAVDRLNAARLQLSAAWAPVNINGGTG